MNNIVYSKFQFRTSIKTIENGARWKIKVETTKSLLFPRIWHTFEANDICIGEVARDSKRLFIINLILMKFIEKSLSLYELILSL